MCILYRTYESRSVFERPFWDIRLCARLIRDVVIYVLVLPWKNTNESGRWQPRVRYSIPIKPLLSAWVPAHIHPQVVGKDNTQISVPPCLLRNSKVGLDKAP